MCTWEKVSCSRLFYNHIRRTYLLVNVTGLSTGSTSLLRLWCFLAAPVPFFTDAPQVDVGGGNCRKHGGGRRCGADGCMKTDVGGEC